MSIFFLAVVALSLQAEERPESRESFIELDSEIQAIKAEILEINREILLLEEASLYPQGEQLVILVSIATGDPVAPQRITLRLDDDTVSQHDYSVSEVTALHQGGVHRLYVGRLNEGEHRLDISLSGMLPRDKDFRQQHSVTVNKSPGRKFMELQLGSEKNTSKPGVNIREWQQ
jgi:hypothetical protein